jgi:DNA transformation protein
MPIDASFADYCCELLASAGPLQARRMFGGFGISTGGLTFAIVADLGAGPTLWLKANENTRPLYEQAGCERFTYAMKGVPRSMDYYSAPEQAMESPQLMAPWALQALDCALKARTATTSQAKRATPPARRAAAPAPKAKASRKSARG